MTSETSETTIFVRFYFAVCYLMLSGNVVFLGHFALDFWTFFSVFWLAYVA